LEAKFRGMGNKNHCISVKEQQNTPKMFEIKYSIDSKERTIMQISI